MWNRCFSTARYWNVLSERTANPDFSLGISRHASYPAEGRVTLRRYRVTAFTNEEEADGLRAKVKWLLEDELMKLGAPPTAAARSGSHISASRLARPHRATGQVPAELLVEECARLHLLPPSRWPSRSD